MPGEAGQHARGLSLAGALAALLALWALLCWPWFVEGLVIPWDARNHFYPQLRFLAAALHAGESAAWAPYVYGGHAQIADPQSLIFAPAMLLLALLDPAPSFAGMDAVVLASLLPGAVGILLIFRRNGWRLEGGLVAALAFAFGGAAAARLQHVSLILSFGLLPLALWLLMRALDRRSLLLALAFAAVAATMAAGRDQNAYLGCLVLAGYAVHACLAAPARWRFVRGRAGVLVAAALAGAALLAVPLLLTLEMTATSNRPAIGYALAAVGSLTPWSLLTALVPDYYGALHEADLYWGPGAFAWGDYANQTDRAINYLYMGAIPAVLVVWHGVFGRRLAAREVRFFVVVLAAALVYALGHYTPLFRLLFEVPGVSLYRRPADAVFVMGFALAVLGGYLAHRLVAEGPPRLSRGAWLALGGAGAGVLAAALPFAAAHGRLGVAAAALGWSAGFAALAAAALVLAARWRARPLAAALPLVLVLAADLARHNAGMAINARDPADYAPLDARRPDPLAAFLAERLAVERAQGNRYRVEVLGLGGPWQNASLVFRLENTLGYNPLRWADYERAVGAGEGSDLPRRRFTPLFPGYRSVMADLLGIRYVAAGAPLETIDRALRPDDLEAVARIGKAHVYRNPRALPRARFVAAIALADLQRLIATGVWPADPRIATVLERLPPDWPAAAGAPAMLPAATVAITSYRHAEVVVAVETARAGMLVLHDLFHPAWRATLDGAPVEIHRADVLFRAVFVPAGRHTVTFRHRPIAHVLRSALRRVLGAAPN